MGAKGQKLTAEQRAKIGDGIRRWHEEARKLWKGEPTHKHCKRCGKTKPLDEFSLRKQKLASGRVASYWHHPCRKCVAKRMKAGREKLRAEGKLKAYDKRQRERRDKRKQRAYVRESKAKRRREEGKPVRGPRNGAHLRDVDMPAEPIARWLREESVLKLDAERPIGQTEDRGIELLAKRTGVSARRLGSLINGEQTAVRLSTIDKILIGLDAPFVLHELYPED